MKRNIMILDAVLCIREGISTKTGKPYSIPFVEIATPLGVVDLRLDTRFDKAGIVLDMLAKDKMLVGKEDE